MKELFEFSLYMLYGLIFMSIGFSILFRDLRFSRLSFAKALPTLAVFGVIHGLHEWSELYLMIYEHDLAMHDTVKVFKVIKLWVSFVALGYFANQMLKMTHWKFRNHLNKALEVVMALFLVSVAYGFYTQELQDIVAKTTISIRWLFGSGAGILAGASLINYSKKLKIEEREAASAVGHLGWAIAVYGLFAGILYMPNSLLGVAVRASLAFFMLFYLRLALQIFDSERQKQIESQLQMSFHNDKLRDMGELASGIAHEIKTPLSSALMRSDLLEQQLQTKPLDIDNATRQLKSIRKGLLRASKISQEILDFTHKKQIKSESINIHEMVSEILELMAHRLEYFDVRVDIDKQLYINADKIQIEETLINIINNAIYASTSVRLIEVLARQKGMQVWISIIDHGGGIAPPLLDKVKQPFFTTKKKSMGTGLGLALCIKNLTYNNGSLILKNENNGLNATIKLPLETL